MVVTAAAAEEEEEAAELGMATTCTRSRRRCTIRISRSHQHTPGSRRRPPRRRRNRIPSRTRSTYSARTARVAAAPSLRCLRRRSLRPVTRRYSGLAALSCRSNFPLPPPLPPGGVKLLPSFFIYFPNTFGNIFPTLSLVQHASYHFCFFLSISFIVI